jgi:hypothetical protein
MVEGVVVASVMVTFFGLILWTRAAYGMKLDLQQRTRSDALFYASSGCKTQGGGTGQQGTVGAGMTGSASGAAQNVANRVGGSGATAVNQSWGSASATANGIATGFVAVNANPIGQHNMIKAPFVSRVTAASFVVCNEPKYGNQLIAWIQFGINFARSGGGIF